MKPLYAYLDDYLEWRRSLRLSPQTIKKNRCCATLFIRWIETAFHVITADRIEHAHLHAWQAHVSTMTAKTGRPVKPVTINTYNESVRGFLAYLAAIGHLRNGLVDEIRYVKIPYRLPGGVLTYAQVRRLLAKIPTDNAIGYRDRAMLELLYSAGIRAGEVLGLDLCDIDFKNHTLIVTGKGNKQRVVPFGTTALRHLETYIRAVRPFMVKDPLEKALFVNAKGGRFHYRCFLDMVHAHAERAGFDNVTPHTFRRSCTTELIRGGANIYHVKEFLGHESLDTLKSYTRLTINDLKKTHEKCHPREKDPA